MERYLHSPRVLAAIGVAVGALTVLLLTLHPAWQDCVYMGVIFCDEQVEGGLKFDPWFEPHYLLVGAAVAAAAYAVLVLAILSVRAIRGKDAID